MRIRILLFALLVVGALAGPAEAWVRAPQLPYPNGEATVIVHRFCLSGACIGAQQSERTWANAIHAAIAQWNNAGSGFQFTTRPAHNTDDPCQPRANSVAIFLAETGYSCPHSEERAAVNRAVSIGAGFASVYPPPSRVYIAPQSDEDDLRRYLLHELGHVVGLKHPDEAGQSVYAVMNSRLGLDTLQEDDIAGIRALYGGDPVEPRFALENPAEGSTVTGVNIFSGWGCDPGSVWVQFSNSDRLLRIPSGMERLDTSDVCGRRHTGFATLFNWNLLGAGEHTVTVYIEHNRFRKKAITRTFTVVDYGEEFRTDLSGEWVLHDWPEVGVDTVVAWNPARQNIEIVDIED